MMRISLILLMAFIAVACNRKPAETERTPVAMAGNRVLYLDELPKTWWLQG